MQFVGLKQRYEYEKVKVQFRGCSHMIWVSGFFLVVELVNWTQFSTEHRGKGWKKLFCEWDPDSGEYFPHFLQSIFLKFRIFLTFLFSPPTNFSKLFP